MFDSDDIEILHETKDMVIELDACVATWATMCGKPEDSSSLVAYLTNLLKTKQDLFYYIVETEVSKDAISPLVEGVVAFVKETNKLYVYSSTVGWVDLTPDLSEFYTKDETDALLALKANIEDFYSKIEADERFATLTDLQAHLDNKNNPHEVTKAQVGLNKVENLAPLEMPISTATQNALNLKQDVITGAVSNVVSDNLPENKLVVTDSNGKLDTTDLIDLSKLELLDGLDGNIQEQLDSKEDKFAKNTAFNRNFTTNLFDIKMDGVASLGVANEIPRADHRHPSDTTKLDKNPLIAPGTATKITYDEKGLVIGGTVLAITDIPDLSSIYEKSIFKVNILNDSTYQYPTTHAVTVAIADKADKSYVDANLQTLNERLNEKENAFTKNTAFNKNFSIDKQELQMDGEANVGTSLNIPRADHRHPTDTTREAIANKTDYYSDASPITYPSSRALYNGLRTRLKPTNVIPGDNVTVTVDGERIIISSYGSKSATWGHIIGNLTDQTDLITYINTGISTASATFRGTFNSYEDLLAYSGEKDNNDYAFVISKDSLGNTVYDRYKYNGSAWSYEYSIDNTTFDADQWASINSKATQAKIAQIATNASDITDLQTNKADKTNVTAGTYTKVTVNSDGLVSSGDTLGTSDIPDLSDVYYLASNPAGYTSNVGTVTSVNNIEPVNGNVTIEIPDSATWGNITGTLSDQTDLQGALDNKVDKTTTADKVYGTDTQGNQTTYDVDSFGQVDDVTVGGTSVVANKIAVLGSMAGETASDYVLVSNVVNDVVSTDTNKPLSANMGKELQDEIDNLKARGRFLALWDCSTGLAETHPTVPVYEYKSGDYFIVGTVAQAGGTNYKPSGSSYTDNVPSTAVETEAVSVNDTYYYDGNVWHLQINTQKEIAFVNIAGDPYDNSNLASALNEKQDELPSQTGQSGKFLTTNGTAISWGDAPVTDVQINSTSILSNGVANIPVGTTSVLGVHKVSPNQGISAYSGGDLTIIGANEAEVIAKTQNYKPIVPSKLDIAIREGLGNNSLTWTDAYKANARNTIGATQAVFVDWSD